eukprot:653261-Prorocentrum_minimum.AAC.1
MIQPDTSAAASAAFLIAPSAAELPPRAAVEPAASEPGYPSTGAGYPIAGTEYPGAGTGNRRASAASLTDPSVAELLRRASEHSLAPSTSTGAGYPSARTGYPGAGTGNPSTGVGYPSAGADASLMASAAASPTPPTLSRRGSDGASDGANREPNSDPDAGSANRNELSGRLASLSGRLASLSGQSASSASSHRPLVVAETDSDSDREVTASGGAKSRRRKSRRTSNLQRIPERAVSGRS